jgi:hypothetical protein
MVNLIFQIQLMSRIEPIKDDIGRAESLRQIS